MHPSVFSRKLLPAWLLFAVGLLASVAASIQVKRNIESNAVAQFAFASDQVATKVRERLESYELILRGGAALFAATGSVTRREWRAFMEEMQAEKIVPGVQGVGF